MGQATENDEKVKRLVEPFFEYMSQRVTPFEMDLIYKAFHVAFTAHSGQKRKSGEPYIVHPVEVARIVGREMELGANPVCAAFLHDVVEDTPYTIEEVERNFGFEVACLVEAVTKRKKESYETSKQVDNFKHMLSSTERNLSALLLKLADRLHNMRTLQSMPAAKQMKIAGETDFFYAPLAFRLGLHDVKTELENLSFRFRCPKEYAQLDHLLQAEREHIQPYLDDFKATVAARLKDIGVDAEIKIVTRRPYSINKKMLRKNVDFFHLERIHSVSIIYDAQEGESEKATALKIYEALTDCFKEKPHSVTNYIDNPKENGYQSLHVHLLAGNGHWQEVRISSRRMARIQRLGCAAGYHSPNIEQWLKRLRANLADMAQHPTDISFMEGVRASFYNDDIVVYSIDGRNATLPEKATVLDLAFELYGEKALHTQCARVNGKLKPVTTQLERGDIVDVVLNDDVHPQHHWQEHVLTYKAKRMLKTWASAQPAPTLARCKHCLPLPGDEVIGFMQDNGIPMVHKRDCPVVISQASQHGDSVVPVDFVDDGTPYMVNFKILAIDRYHLLSDIIDCITEQLGLSIDSLKTTTKEHIVCCYVNFYLYSFDQLQTAVETINGIPGVEEVSRPEIDEAVF